ncbi:MAG: molybdopterin-guanine dinucleotide biosynthesis protein MobB, partial [Clostridia bacterium]|nr:molybdopterin-guanine dinucleotide biosynthesis protein MobB [Clostridia bacterium]
GTDTYRFLEVGASGTVIFDDHQMSVSRKSLPPYEELFTMFPDADLLLVEGLRNTALPKLEMVKPDDERSPALSEDKVLGYIAENAAYEASVPVFDREDVKGIADFIMELYESGALKGAVL